jgi:hypothetical protein
VVVWCAGVIEQWSGKLGLPDPQLSSAQRAMSKSKRVSFLATVVGISVGCLLGMFPLLFIETNEVREPFEPSHRLPQPPTTPPTTPPPPLQVRETFDSIDIDGSGSLDLNECRVALKKLGFKQSADQVGRGLSLTSRTAS